MPVSWQWAMWRKPSPDYLNKFYPGTKINGISCSGKTVAEMKEDIKKTSETYTLTLQGKETNRKPLAEMPLV